MEKSDSRDVLLSVFGVALLIVAVAGISYAIFTFTKYGTKENIIKTGAISMSFVESSNNIIKISATSFDMLTDIGKSKIIKIILTISSIIFDIELGSIFSFPCKNPLCILVVVTKGIMKIIDNIGLNSISFLRIRESFLDNISINDINIISIMYPILYAAISIFLSSCFPSATSLLTDSGRENWQIVIISIKVGISMVYKLTIFIPAILV